MKKILINSPILSSSGYGEMARLALNVLMQHQDEYDIYINILSWGQTSWITAADPMFDIVQAFRHKTENYIRASNNKPFFDVSLQITIPNEWKRMAPYNIGYTAGIETTLISPQWLEPSNSMDKIITISEFAKSVFVNTNFGDGNGNTLKVTTPIDVVGFPVEKHEYSELPLNLETDFNFLCVNQWGPRKNMEFLISNFVQEFANDDVGLVLKTNFANNSITDRVSIHNLVESLLVEHRNRKCKVYVLHGQLTKAEMYSVYRHPKIKAFVTATHGEGFGVPIFEATQAELPVVATDWSAHIEHLTMPDDEGKPKKLFGKVAYELKAIEAGHVWKGVMEPQSGWAYPMPVSLRGRMREVIKDYGRYKSWAKKLANYNNSLYTKEKVYSNFYNSLKVASPQDDLIIL